ncbi:MAG TPA: ParB/RepB/Spo0J family partition protein [Verrucomicrobiales bacterium]|nr:ParB/RepB/Spo0J family partition protein [Verrucomicrobiales bacterium]
MSKNALGKGLGALISGAAKRGVPASGNNGDVPVVESASAPATGSGDRVTKVPVSDIRSSPMQPRKTFRDEQLGELMESIREHGVIQPLVVRRVNGVMELIAGERRFRACQQLGLTEVPVIERAASDRDVLEMALIENLQREDLNPVEEAEAYARLAKEFGMRQEDIAQRVGKNRATVANSMRLLDLAPEVKLLLAQSLISTGHAKAILGLRDADLQRLLADRVVRQGLTVRQTEQEVQRDQQQGEGERKPGKKTSQPGGEKQLGAAISRIQSNLREKLATQVTIHHGDKKGRIEIEYYGNDDLGRLLELFGVSAD